MSTVAQGQLGYTADLSRKVLAGTLIAAFWMAEGTMTAFAVSLVASRSIEREAWRRPAQGALGRRQLRAHGGTQIHERMQRSEWSAANDSGIHSGMARML